MNKSRLYMTIAVIVFIGIAWITYQLVPKYEKRTIDVGDVQVKVEVVDTEEERQQGLSGRDSLASGTGMLFVFEKDGLHSFWMKDMKFPIDILWISEGGEIVYMARHVSPDTYPNAIEPEAAARYVLEVPAGFAERHGVTVGVKVRL